ncbi:MAG: nucleoside-diphosphate kinase [bacterium]|nr:nucleoside-diphosphate kinase [Patescibacteria group bacterium]MDW8279820.1 nucleoside-diphosphate kinase [bacterium]
MNHPKYEKTLVIIKPDGVQRGLIGEVIKRYERVGLKLVALKMIIPNEELVEKHYLVDPEWIIKVGLKSIESYKKKGIEPPSENPEIIGQKVLQTLKKYFISGPVVVMVWEGVNACGIVRKITGGTEPLTSDVGTIRGDFTIDSYEIADTTGRAVRNIIHASGSKEEAEKEITVWFKPEEILRYKLISERILYDVNLDGILE